MRVETVNYNFGMEKMLFLTTIEIRDAILCRTTQTRESEHFLNHIHNNLGLYCRMSLLDVFVRGQMIILKKPRGPKLINNEESTRTFQKL